MLALLAVLLLSITLYYGVVFRGSLPDHPILHGRNDLFLHFCAFLALTIPLRLLWLPWYSLAIPTVFAVLIEAIQTFQPHRTASLNDLAASLLGVLVGATLVALLQRAILKISNKQHE